MAHPSLEKSGNPMPAILIVEDEAKMLRVLHLHLTDEGFTTHPAADAETGLKILNREKIDLVVTDFKLPGMSGLELLPKAKAARPDVPIIMITAYGDAETKRQALEKGAEALLTKPIDFGTLRSEIDMRVNAPHEGTDSG